jgi:hypothetical protein
MTDTALRTDADWDSSDKEHVHIASECASGLCLLPEVWRKIMTGDAPCASPDRDALVQMMMLMHHKFTKGDVDLVNQIEDEGEREAMRTALTYVMKSQVTGMLEYFGRDWDPARYPNFDTIEAQLDKSGDEYEDRLGVLRIGRTLFEYFGYYMPASFYWVYLAPIERAGICEIVPLRFSEQDKANARAWDSWLHAGKVFPFLHTIQSISAEQAQMVWLHGCGCNHGLSRLSKTDAVYHYRMDEEAKEMWLRDAIWTAMYEYTFFLFTPVTRLMTGELVEFG